MATPHHVFTPQVQLEGQLRSKDQEREQLGLRLTSAQQEALELQQKVGARRYDPLILLARRRIASSLMC